MARIEKSAAPTENCEPRDDLEEALRLRSVRIAHADHPDIELLAAEQEFHQLEARVAALVDADADEDTEIDPVYMSWMAVMDMIELTPPATLAGCAVKLRILLHEHVGLPAGSSEHDMICLEQVRDFLEGITASS
jgi:hypothetical protein